MQSKTDKESFDAKKTLEDSASNARSSKFFTDSKSEQLEQEQKDMETLLSTFTESVGDQQDQNFSQDNKLVPKKKDDAKK